MNPFRSHFKHADKSFGEKSSDSFDSFVHQEYSDTCAIKSQQLILNDFGENVTEDELREEAIKYGWYRPEVGTFQEDIGNLLEHHGVEINKVEGANIYSLVSELAQGRKVLVGVDSRELWQRGFYENPMEVSESGAHVVLVTGVDTTDLNNIKVIITDPGTGDYNRTYPLDQFQDAWNDFKCFMVSTKEPAPLAHNPEMINFDYEKGYVEKIGNQDFEEVLEKAKMENPESQEASSYRFKGEDTSELFQKAEYEASEEDDNREIEDSNSEESELWHGASEPEQDMLDETSNEYTS